MSQELADNTQPPPLEMLTGDALRQEVRRLLENGDEWLETPNVLLHGRTPGGVIGTGDEHLVREILLASVYGGVS